MLNKGILIAWLRSTAFWICIIVLTSGLTGFVYVAISLAWALGVAAISCFIGVGGYVAYRTVFVQGETKNAIGPTSRRGSTLSVGGLPAHPPPLQAAFEESLFDGVMDFSGYARRYPAHAALMLAGARVMMSKPGLPASPVPGGHGGATLIEHSLRVIKSMGRAVPEWKFFGHQNKDGTFWHQVKVVNGVDFHCFAQSDPILPLAAFLHDIGKVVCYTMDAKGLITEKTQTAFTFEGSVLDRNKEKRRKVDHDTEGAKLLRRLPETWALPPEDVTALLFAVGYYHKVGSVLASEWITDRARSLIELLVYADNQAGLEESGAIHPLDDEGDELAKFVSNNVASTDFSETSINSQIASKTIGDKAQEVNKTPVSNKSAAQNGLTSDAVAEVLPSNLQDMENNPEMLNSAEFDMFLDIMLEENRINGSNAREKVGFKFGEWVYISDAKLRSALAKKHNEPKFAVSVNPGVMHEWTKRLLCRLDAIGALKKDLDGAEFSYRGALFTTTSAIEGHTVKEEKFVMIVKSSILGSVRSIPDCKSPPTVVKCSFGAGRAINKKGSVANESGPELGDEVPVIDESDINYDEGDIYKVIGSEVNPEPEYEPEYGNETEVQESEALKPFEMTDGLNEFDDNQNGLDKKTLASKGGGRKSLLNTGKPVKFDLAGMLVDAVLKIDPKLPSIRMGKCSETKRDRFFFDVDDVAARFGIGEDDMGDAKIVTGKATGKRFIVVLL